MRPQHEFSASVARHVLYLLGRDPELSPHEILQNVALEASLSIARKHYATAELEIESALFLLRVRPEDLRSLQTPEPPK